MDANKIKYGFWTFIILISFCLFMYFGMLIIKRNIENKHSYKDDLKHENFQKLSDTLRFTWKTNGFSFNSRWDKGVMNYKAEFNYENYDLFIKALNMPKAKYYFIKLKCEDTKGINLSEIKIPLDKIIRNKIDKSFYFESTMEIAKSSFIEINKIEHTFIF